MQTTTTNARFRNFLASVFTNSGPLYPKNLVGGVRRARLDFGCQRPCRHGCGACLRCTRFFRKLDCLISDDVGSLQNRNAISSTCAAVKPFPGSISGGPFQYGTQSYIHRGAARCVTFTYATSTCTSTTNGDLAFVSVYNGAFDPSNVATNYLGDIGTSTTSFSMGVVLAPGQTVTLVVNGVQAGLNCSFVVADDFSARDFNLNFKSDILWRDTSGNVAIWLINGTAIQSATTVGNVPTAWSVVGQRDFNGDGHADLLWRDNAGNVAIWLMNGASIHSAAIVGNVPDHAGLSSAPATSTATATRTSLA